MLLAHTDTAHVFWFVLIPNSAQLVLVTFLVRMECGWELDTPLYQLCLISIYRGCIGFLVSRIPTKEKKHADPP